MIARAVQGMASYPGQARCLAFDCWPECFRRLDVKVGPNRTLGVCGWASGPATTSNNALSGAGPSRRRRSRSAFSDGSGTSRPASLAVSLPHTRAQPGSTRSGVGMPGRWCARRLAGERGQEHASGLYAG